MLDISPVFREFPFLETERLRLRRPSRDDAEAMFACMSDPAVVQFFGVPPMQAVGEAEKRITGLCAAFSEKEGIRWALELKSTGEFIGTAGPWRWVPAHFRAEIGYEMARQHWGKGLMSEALAVALDFCFDSGLHSIEANIHPDNQPSRRLLERLGFREEGCTRESWFEAHLGIFTDNAVFGLLAHDWASKDRSSALG